jgi:hypothetical protein
MEGPRHPAHASRSWQSPVAPHCLRDEDAHDLDRRKSGPRPPADPDAGADDLDRALAFYRDGLGFASPGVIGTEFRGDVNAEGAIAIFTLDDGLIFAVYSPL